MHPCLCACTLAQGGVSYSAILSAPYRSMEEVHEHGTGYTRFKHNEFIFEVIHDIADPLRLNQKGDNRHSFTEETLVF